jgi:hypothetical protein
MGDRSKVIADQAGKPAPAGVRCSFCRQRQGEVLAMFAGPDGVHICAECIDLFAQEIAKRRAGS